MPHIYVFSMSQDRLPIKLTPITGCNNLVSCNLISMEVCSIKFACPYPFWGTLHYNIYVKRVFHQSYDLFHERYQLSPIQNPFHEDRHIELRFWATNYICPLIFSELRYQGHSCVLGDSQCLIITSLVSFLQATRPNMEIPVYQLVSGAALSWVRKSKIQNEPQSP